MEWGGEVASDSPMARTPKASKSRITTGKRILPASDGRSARPERALLGAGLCDSASWSVWLSVLRAAFGQPLTDEQQRLFVSVAGNRSASARGCASSGVWPAAASRR